MPLPTIESLNRPIARGLERAAPDVPFKFRGLYLTRQFDAKVLQEADKILEGAVCVVDVIAALSDGFITLVL